MDVVEKRLGEYLRWGFRKCVRHWANRDEEVSKCRDTADWIRGAFPVSVGSSERLSLEWQGRDQLGLIATGLEELGATSKPVIKGGQEMPPSPPPFQSAKFVYIPTLRGMRLGLSNPRDNSEASYAYFDRTWTDYFKGKGPDGSRISDLNSARESLSGKTIFTGLDFYKRLTDLLLGGLKDRQLVKDYETFLSNTFFGGKRVALIPRRDHDTVNIKVGNEKERPVQELGDGLQQLIILTLPLFEHKDVPLFLFIEEPDLFLHPGYQRVLIDAILENRERNLYVFVTTHSSQFLDITISSDDCTIFRCSKKAESGDDLEHDPKFEVTNSLSGDQELLKHIGVRPSSVMLSNCTIWVEGITDRLYYSRYVKFLLEERKLAFIENLHYSFVEYGGGNITHWSFLDEDGIDVKRLCSKLMLITDKDEDKDKRHAKLEKELGRQFVLLPVKESENLLTPEVIKKVIVSYEETDSNLKEFAQSDYAEMYLGTFIDENVLVDKGQSKRVRKLGTAYKDTSGTIKDKVEFCRRALLHINSKADMSQEAITLAERICNFIQNENQ
ncbi:MAG: ATP-dependent nuclease [Planctomycetaceae bacterium]